MSCTKDLRHGFEMKSKHITLCVFFADVIILIIVLCVLWAMPEPETPGKDCGYMCFKCPTITDEHKMCCGCRDEVLKEYIQRTFDAKYKIISKEYDDMFISSSTVTIKNGSMGDFKPAAHVVGEDRDKPSRDDLLKKTVLPVRKWYRGANCLLLNGISLHRGRLRVPVTGHYHVYSVIDFNYQLFRDKDNTIRVNSNSSCLRHAIFKSNLKSKHPQELMMTHHPYEMSKNLLFARYDTFISGDVHLEAGDEVYVKVANISYASSPPKNVFGIHMI